MLLIAALARPASAHQLDLSQGQYAFDGPTLRATLVFASPDLAASLPELDDDHDGHASQIELERHRDALARAIVGGLKVLGDGSACPGSLDTAEAVESDAVRVDARYACPAPPATVTFAFAFLERFAPAHRHVVTFAGRPPELVMAASPRLEVAVSQAPSAAAGERAAFLEMLRTGVEHIVTGYDHLAFLVALVLVGGRPRSLVGVVTAFTVAHSLTLGLAALHVLTPSPRFVEPAIALSIAYVAIENFFVKDASRRWRITFPFGLVHGFGFASSLAAIDLPRARVPEALLAFNLGVEVGQLAVLAALAAPLYFLRKSPWFRDRGVKLASAALAAVGLVLFAVRVAA